MEVGYPKLIGVAAANRGCRLLLSDGSEARVDVSAAQIDAHLARCGLQTLAEFCRRQDVAVLGGLIEVGPEVWDRLMHRLRESEAVQRLVAERPGLREALRVSHAQASALPLRVFECFHRSCVYLFFPYTFHPEQDAPAWYRVAFDLPGDWILQGRLQISSGVVEVEALHSQGWYIAAPGDAANGGA